MENRCYLVIEIPTEVRTTFINNDDKLQYLALNHVNS